ncbi:hypothetical protein JFV28_18370 [Pseudomonas sp. TH05]|uniref:hypothetical protein n=1 Tax=unclassified Pseudomonas TaxID=196821 RepID=UPI001913633B|nr:MULTISPECIES: hypothetical protein [unclassified Pseudomonas]MBK5538532.1 hypothetical protein [Pseudomonas sp. TH07]MBK5557810.1 hypothetical protein [Pseudomonas sp. TH05]
MAANQKLRRENPDLVPHDGGYLLPAKNTICVTNQALSLGRKHFVGFAETRFSFDAGKSTYRQRKALYCGKLAHPR